MVWALARTLRAAALLVLCVHTEAQMCARHARHLSCGSYSGLKYQVMNNEHVYHVDNLTDWKALIVPPHITLSVSLCNYGNVYVEDVTIRNQSIVPSLVSEVGQNSTVRIHIVNSANLIVYKRLVLGFSMSEKHPHNFEYNDTSIIDKVVRGPVADGASILVDLEHSANVRLLKGTEDLRIGKATLLNELINAPHWQNMHCIENACFEVRVEHSANVYCDERGAANIFIQDGQLDDESVDTGCLGQGTFVRVAKRNVSNVFGARTLHIWEGELSDETIDALHIRDAHVEVSIRDSGNVWADHVRIAAGELVDEIVDARDVNGAEVSITLQNVGNIDSQSVDIFEGELVDEAVDARDMIHSRVAITMTDVGNVRVSKVLSITEGELVDEVLDASSINSGSIDIRLERVASVLCGAGVVSLSNSELLETIIDTVNIHNVRASVYMVDTANVHVRSDWLHFVNGVLARRPYDVDLMNSGVKFTKISSMENLCARCPGSSYSCVGSDSLMTAYHP